MQNNISVLDLSQEQFQSQVLEKFTFPKSKLSHQSPRFIHFFQTQFAFHPDAFIEGSFNSVQFVTRIEDSADFVFRMSRNTCAYCPRKNQRYKDIIQIALEAKLLPGLETIGFVRSPEDPLQISNFAILQKYPIDLRCLLLAEPNYFQTRAGIKAQNGLLSLLKSACMVRLKILDLKPSNIVCDPFTGDVKLIDLDESVFITLEQEPADQFLSVYVFFLSLHLATLEISPPTIFYELLSRPNCKNEVFARIRKDQDLDYYLQHYFGENSPTGLISVQQAWLKLRDCTWPREAMGSSFRINLSFWEKILRFFPYYLPSLNAQKKLTQVLTQDGITNKLGHLQCPEKSIEQWVYKTPLQTCIVRLCSVVDIERMTRIIMSKLTSNCQIKVRFGVITMGQTHHIHKWSSKENSLSLLWNHRTTPITYLRVKKRLDLTIERLWKTSHKNVVGIWGAQISLLKLSSSLCNYFEI